MSNVMLPGEDFLTHLLRYLKEHDIALLTGRVALRLQPRALEYAASRLDSLHQLQSANTTPAASVTESNIKGVDEYLRLETLQTLLSHVRCLRIVSALPGLRDPTGIRLEPFTALTSLHLSGCDLSTANWAGLPLLQSQLQELRVYDTLEAVHHLLAPHAVAVTPAGVAELPAWGALRVLGCSHNCIAAMDASLLLLPALQRLELTHANVTGIAHLAAFTALTALDLSHNRIASAAGLTELATFSNLRQAILLQRLSLPWNALRSTQGMEQLVSLTSLDLESNFVSSISEIARLSGLCNLQSLRLEGNPVAYARSFRCDVLSCFAQRTSLRLDGAAANAHERARLRRRPSGGRMNQLCSPAASAQPDRWRAFVDDLLGPIQSDSTRREEALGLASTSGRDGPDGSAADRRAARRREAAQAFARCPSDFMSLRWAGDLPLRPPGDEPEDAYSRQLQPQQLVVAGGGRRLDDTWAQFLVTTDFEGRRRRRWAPRGVWFKRETIDEQSLPLQHELSSLSNAAGSTSSEEFADYQPDDKT